jgi:RNA polymerase sigma-70 factor (ECF subfamily)
MADPAATLAHEDERQLAADQQARRVIREVLEGNHDAFRILVERETPAAFRLCYRVLGDRGDAEDAVQEAFVSAFRALPAWREDGSFSAWLARITLHVALRRSRRPRPVAWIDTIDAEVIGDDHDGSGSSGAAGRRLAHHFRSASLAAAPFADPALIALRSEEAEAVRAAVAGLPEPYREVIALRYFGQLSVPEIAAVSRRPLGTVKTHLHRGLMRLRSALDGQGVAP